LAWTPDSKEIIFSSNRKGPITLWRIPAKGGTSKLLFTGGQDITAPTISRQDDLLAYVQGGSTIRNIWRMTVSNIKSNGLSNRFPISSTYYEGHARYSPDGKQIVFISERTGFREIWLCDSEGTNLIQLTYMDSYADRPDWSPNGEEIVFSDRTDDKINIYIIKKNGGNPRPLTDSRYNNIRPRWSRDGNYIYFISTRTGTEQVWKISKSGDNPKPITQNGARACEESYDGKWIYFVKVDTRVGHGGLWKISVKGGDESLVIDKDINWNKWTVGKEGIYFIDDSQSTSFIDFYDFNTSDISRVGELGTEHFIHLDVSPDGHYILYTKSERTDADIKLVKNFR
jgi:Tol biopolymer transport system component